MNEETNYKPLGLSPLFNHIIMRKVTSYLGFSDWKMCRLVCSFWNSIVLETSFNKNTTIHLEHLSLEQFLQYLQQYQLSKSTVHCPGFENYDLKINSGLSKSQIVNSLWDEVGHKMKNLKLELTTRYAIENLRNVLFKNTDSLENLKIIVTKFWGSLESNSKMDKLKLETFSYDPYMKPNFNLTSFSYSYLGSLTIFGFEESDTFEGLEFKFPIPWTEFFEYFPNLKFISLVCMSEVELTEMFSTLKELKKKTTKCLPNLRSLEILDENICPESLNNSHLESLIQLQPIVTELHLEISPLLRTNLLNTFLNLVSVNLKVLRLRRFPLPFRSESEQITLKLFMEFVTVVEISDGLVPSLEFLPFFPKLETLHVILRDYRNLLPCGIVDNTPSTLEPHNTLKNVYIEPPLLSEDCITSLERIVPNLKVLKIRMDDEMMWALCGSQSASSLLEELHVISWDGLTDEGFTGIPENVLRNRMGITDVLNHRIYPYIGDLRNSHLLSLDLRKLTVEMWPDYSSHISDDSVYHGFLDLVNLKEFIGIRTEISSMAKTRMHFPSCYLSD